MIDRAAGQVSADGHANHRRTRKSVVRAPADQRQFIAQLLHRGPNVIKKLYLRHRFETARGHANGAAHDVGLRQRRIEHAFRAKITLQVGGQLEHATLALHLLLLQILLARAIGHVLAEHHDALIAPHLIAQASIDEIGHGLIAALGCRLRFKH